MQRALEFTTPLAVLEAVVMVLWVLMTMRAWRRNPGGEPLDDGPWWSVWFFRLWMVLHIPVLLLQTGIHALFRKEQFNVAIPLLVGAFLFHALNLALVFLLVMVTIE